MNKKTNEFVPMVKRGKTFKEIGDYKGTWCSGKKGLPALRKQIEEEYPKYKGKVVFFEYVLEKTSY